MDQFQLFVSRFFHNAFFSKTIKELPLVALFSQEENRLYEKMLSTAIWGAKRFVLKSDFVFLCVNSLKIYSLMK